MTEPVTAEPETNAPGILSAFFEFLRNLLFGNPQKEQPEVDTEKQQIIERLTAARAALDAIIAQISAPGIKMDMDSVAKILEGINPQAAKGLKAAEKESRGPQAAAPLAAQEFSSTLKKEEPVIRIPPEKLDRARKNTPEQATASAAKRENEPVIRIPPEALAEAEKVEPIHISPKRGVQAEPVAERAAVPRAQTPEEFKQKFMQDAKVAPAKHRASSAGFGGAWMGTKMATKAALWGLPRGLLAIATGTTTGVARVAGFAKTADFLERDAGLDAKNGVAAMGRLSKRGLEAGKRGVARSILTIGNLRTGLMIWAQNTMEKTKRPIADPGMA